MKKKTYLPFGLMVIIYGLFFLAVVAVAVVLFVKKGFGTLQIILISVLLALTLYYFLSPIIMYAISLKDKKLSMHKDFGIFKEDRIQSKTEVDLEKVTEYKVIISDRNSEGIAYSSKAPKKTYIEFILDGEPKPKRLYVSCMAKKQILKILSDVKEITGIEVTRKEEKKPEEK